MNYLKLLSVLGIGGAHPGGILLTKKIIEDLSISVDAKVLDAGCGTGQTTSYLYQLGYDVCGLDIDPTMIYHARNRNKNINNDILYLHEDLQKTTLDNDMFDLVLCESVLNFTSLHPTLAEISRILLPNGLLIAIEMNKQSPLTDIEEKELKTFYGCNHIYSLDEWKQQFIDNGFSVYKVLTPEELTLNVSEEPTTEFSPLETIPDRAFSLLTEHERLTIKYSNQLSFCVFFCHNNKDK